MNKNSLSIFFSCPSDTPFLSYVPLRTKFENLVCKISLKSNCYIYMIDSIIFICKTITCYLYLIKGANAMPLEIPPQTVADLRRILPLPV